MADGFDDVFVATRRQLRGVAESLIAGPQYRATGTIRLAVRPDGFTGVTVPIGVHGTELVWPQGSAPLAGPVSAIAEAAGVQAGPPVGVYDIVDPLAADAVLDIDPAAAEFVYRSHYAGGHALKTTLPEQHPVLWPEHFDVSATENEVTYGISAGDSYPSDALRVRGPADCAHRTVLEHPIRRGAATRSGPRCRRAQGQHCRFLRPRPTGTVIGDDSDRGRNRADRRAARWRRSRLHQAGRPAHPVHAAGGARLCAQPRDRRRSGSGNLDRIAQGHRQVRGPIFAAHLAFRDHDQYRQGSRRAGAP